MQKNHSSQITGNEALQMLKNGNELYASNPQWYLHNSENIEGSYTQPTDQQRPLATVLSCSDSRIPVEIVFGRMGIGDIFVVRNAGNIVNVNTIGSMEYSVANLSVPLIIVMGHKNCGAVTAACNVVLKNTSDGHTEHIQEMIKPIISIAANLGNHENDFIDRVAREHTTSSVEKILHSSAVIREYIHNKRAKIVAAYYDIYTRQVEFIES